MAHDRAYDLHAPSSAIVPAGGVDPLSDVLQAVRLRGALFFQVEASDPWCVDVPAARAYAGIIMPRARHVVSYHIVLKGRGLAALPGMEPVRFEAGDILVFPQADPYVMTSAPGVPPELDDAETIQFFRDLAARRLPFVIPEGGGGEPRAGFVCGFLGCDLSPCNPLFAALPRMLHIRRPAEAGDLLDRLTDLALAEARAARPGGDRVRLGLSELMFVEMLRRHLASLAADAPGWLAGLRDPVAGQALALLHGAPARNWTLAELAQEAGASRSVLAERFAARIGMPPMRYLAQWRMQLAEGMLADGDVKVATVAERVGYASEAAFSRAFKKITGRAPAAWRGNAGG